jgi:hypothetical protein
MPCEQLYAGWQQARKTLNPLPEPWPAGPTRGINLRAGAVQSLHGRLPWPLQSDKEKVATPPPPPRDTPAGDMQPALAAHQAGEEAQQARHEQVVGESGGVAAAAPEVPLGQEEQQDDKVLKRPGRRIMAS